MKIYHPRIADNILSEKLESAGAVLIEGTKWCGKTTTAEQKAKSIIYISQLETIKENIQMADINPRKLLEGKTPRLIDEWQVTPKLWDVARFEIDQRGEVGQFIFTGSSVPPDTNEIVHTGTGRFASVKMRPMSLWESGNSSGDVSLKNLFQTPETLEGNNKLELEDISFLICRGGWPQTLSMKESASLEVAYNYLDAIVNSDINRVDNITKNPDRVRSLMHSLSRNIGTQAPNTTICNDISNNGTKSLNVDTIALYTTALKNIFVIEDIPAWNPNLRSKTAIRTSDTRYFVDPSIAVASLEIGPEDLKTDLNTCGFLFESLCIRDLRVYADALHGRVYHYRDKDNLECDAVIHIRKGKYGLIEIKLGGSHAIEEAATNLKKLEAKLDTTRMNKPSFMMILIGIGSYAYRRPDGIYVVPIGCLKD